MSKWTLRCSGVNSSISTSTLGIKFGIAYGSNRVKLIKLVVDGNRN